MNRKGIYTSIIGIILLAIIAGTIFYLANPVNEIRTSNYTNATMELNYEMQNSRYLLDKAIGDALFDYVWTNAEASSCSKNAGGADVEKYMQDAILVLDNCTANILLSPGNTEATVIVICDKKIKKGDEDKAEFSVHIEKRFNFSKTVTAIESPNPGPPASTDCTITVRDNQSNTVECTGKKNY